MTGEAEPRRWSFLTSHGLALLVITRDPHVRLRDIAEAIGVTERTAQRVVNDLTDAGYLLRERVQRRNVYTVRSDLPFRLPPELEGQIAELLAVLAPATVAAAAAAQATLNPVATTEAMDTVE